MIKLVSSALIGALFGLGIAISGMANPAKVLNFFDIFGTWDASLAFVMGGALLTTALGYAVIFGRQAKPVFEPAFAVPQNRIIGPRLVLGSAGFGVGWGIAGFCPGGALPALGLGHPEVWIFVAAMVAGIALARFINNRGKAAVAA